MDDARVRKCSEEEAMKQTAYILFYQTNKRGGASAGASSCDDMGISDSSSSALHELNKLGGGLRKTRSNSDIGDIIFPTSSTWDFKRPEKK